MVSWVLKIPRAPTRSGGGWVISQRPTKSSLHVFPALRAASLSGGKICMLRRQQSWPTTMMQHPSRGEAHLDRAEWLSSTSVALTSWSLAAGFGATDPTRQSATRHKSLSHACSYMRKIKATCSHSMCGWAQQQARSFSLPTSVETMGLSEQIISSLKISEMRNKNHERLLRTMASPVIIFVGKATSGSRTRWPAVFGRYHTMRCMLYQSAHDWSNLD